MCQDCHESITDSIITEQLQNVKTSTFEDWNQDALSKVYLASVGYNGLKALDLANLLLIHYSLWIRKNKPTEYNSVVDIIRSSIDIQSICKKKKLCHEQIRQYVLKNKICLPLPNSTEPNIRFTGWQWCWNRFWNIFQNHDQDKESLIQMCHI